jgi:hypothetical protein
MRVCLLLLALSLSRVAWAGVRLDFQDESDKSEPVQRLKVSGDKLRYERGNSGSTQATIFDGTQIIIVSDKSKTYTVIDQATLQKYAEAMKQMETQLPPEARARYEKAMGDQGGNIGKFTFQKASGGDTVAGFSCSNYTESHNGEVRATICAASWKSGPLHKEELGGLKKISALLTNSGGLVKKSFFFDPDEWPGFPVLTRTVDGKVTRLTAVTRGDIPDSDFQPPAGYARKAMSPMGRGGAE